MNRIAAVTMSVLLVLSASAALADGATTTKLTTDKIDFEETTFGDLATDALCKVGSTTVAMAPAATFKRGQEVAPGTVSEDAVSGLLYVPDEKWAVIELKGAQIRNALERSVSFAPKPRVFFLQVSGLKVLYDHKAPRGRKVKDIRVGTKELDDTAKYQVAMPESLAAGGAGYFTIFGGAAKIRSGAQGLASSIVDYVDGKGKVSYTGRGRIIVGKAWPQGALQEPRPSE